MIGTTISHYKILSKLGEGGMGVVYKAEDTKLKRIVALKFLPQQLTANETDKARFLQEAQAAAALNHPNVCVIHDIQEHEGQRFIVMEYVEGQTLRNKMKNERLKIKESIDYATQIAEALKAAHAKDIIHRDIKSENIMVTSNGQIKVMDFGLAKLRGSVKLTKTSTTAGTLSYTSPEQIQGKEVDARSDIFSFGVVLYEMLTGQLPFKGEYDSAVVYSILDEEPEPVQQFIPGVSSELIHLINRILEKDPENRYQSMKDVLIDLKRMRRETDQISRESLKYMPVTDKNRPAEKSKKHNWIVVATAAVLMILVLWFVGQRLIRTGTEVPAVSENSVAVMYFDNRSGEDNFGKILTEMLTSNLSRCKQINVMSSQHLFDILKRMGKEDIETIDRNVATDVATSARVQTMLLGSIYKIGSTLNVNAQLCDVRTGSVIGPAQARGSHVEDIYLMVNQLTEDVIQLMGVLRTADSQPLKINDVTTYSFEAYKHYQKGMENLRRWNWQDGRNEFREAVRMDTTFAMAHSYLAYSSGIFKVANPLSDLSTEREHMRLANKYSQKATDRERSIISTYSALIKRDYHAYLARAKALAANYTEDTEIYSRLAMANYMNGNYGDAAEADKKVLEINPESANTYNMLSYYYSAMNEHDKAISAVRNYIALQPDVSNTYDSAFEIYLMAGQYNAAYQICEEALKVNPQWTEFREYESYIHLFRGEGEKAREKNRDIAKQNPSWEFDLVNDLGCFNMVEGRYQEAAAEYQRAVGLAHKKDDTGNVMNARLVLGKCYSMAGNYPEAIREFSEVKELSKKVCGQSYNTWPVRTEYYSGVTLIRRGDYDGAISTAERIKNYIIRNQYDDILMDYYYLLLAEVDIKRTQYTAAANMIDKVSIFTQGNFPRCRSLKADLLVQQSRFEDAIRAYQEFYDDWGTIRASFGGNFFDYFLERSLVHYRVARLYERIGDRLQAISYYQKALDQWKNADDKLPELIEVKARLKQLSGKN